MQGELENLYNEYKQKNKLIPSKNTLKNISPTTKQGVPNPFLDGELDVDCNSVYKCQKCGSFNISVDVTTNKMTCQECGDRPDKSTRVDFQKMMEKTKEEEESKIIDSLKRGDVFLR